MAKKLVARVQDQKNQTGKTNQEAGTGFDLDGDQDGDQHACGTAAADDAGLSDDDPDTAAAATTAGDDARSPGATGPASAPPPDADLTATGDDGRSTTASPSPPSTVPSVIATGDDGRPQSRYLAPPRSDIAAAGDGVPRDVLALIDQPKTGPQGGIGLGDREIVVCKTGEHLVAREPRKGDEERPRCPNCSNDSVAVLCGAGTSPPMTTRYYCPIPFCDYATETLRKPLADEFRRRQRGQKTKPHPQPHFRRP
jgi:hypothetical protein